MKKMKEKMDFVWKMNEETWKELMDDHKKKDDHNFDRGDNMYGQCFVGNLCAEILHTHDASDWYVYTNIYALGINTGYGETEDGTPYTLIEDGPVVPMNAAMFGEFKEKFEESFMEYIASDKKRIELAKMPLGKW